MDIIVPIVIAIIICIQIVFFIKNINRMNEFSNIFQCDTPWELERDFESDYVTGIKGKGNEVFESIKKSINKYLGSHTGSVIDFHLLKDAVDRHCDSVENDINTQTPTPLYCGLAGTMAGVILGLVPLIMSGALVYLLSGNVPEDMDKEKMDLLAAQGINELLKGVAWAMVASICGIIFTTISSLAFKNCKLREESGKNTFLAWMQSVLLPELPSDTSQALNSLAKNLNRFNHAFAQNTSELRSTLDKVNASYKIQAEVIKTVHDMDVMKMANANVRVLQELDKCTDKLETFNEYLNDVQGYTDTIHRFTTLFEQESNRLHILEEIKEFFTRHKAEIAKDTADVDVALKEALEELKNSTSNNVSELNKQLLSQSEDFKTFLKEEKNSFEEINEDLKAQFKDKIEEMPLLVDNIKEIARIPERLDSLVEKVEQSNANLAAKISDSLNHSLQTIAKSLSKNSSIEKVGNEKVCNENKNYLFPTWMNWTIVVTLVVIALSCVLNLTYNVIVNELQLPIVETDKNIVIQEKQKVKQKDTIMISSKSNDNKTIGDDKKDKTELKDVSNKNVNVKP